MRFAVESEREMETARRCRNRGDESDGRPYYLVRKRRNNVEWRQRRLRALGRKQEYTIIIARYCTNVWTNIYLSENETRTPRVISNRFGNWNSETEGTEETHQQSSVHSLRPIAVIYTTILSISASVPSCILHIATHPVHEERQHKGCVIDM